MFAPHRHMTAQLSLWANGICERFHRTVQEEFYRVAFRKKLYRSLEELQSDLDVWMRQYNDERAHSGKWQVLPWEETNSYLKGFGASGA